MEQVTLEKGFYVETPNQPGTTSQLTTLLSKNGQNLKAIWGSTYSGKGHFAIITDNPSKVADVLKSSPFSNFREEEYVVAYIPDQKGSAAEFTQKLADANVNITWLYSTYFNGKPAIVFTSDDNKRVMQSLKQ